MIYTEKDRGCCFYTTKSRNMRRDKSVPACNPYNWRRQERWQEKAMLTAFKTLIGILCHGVLSPVLLASSISQPSVCFCLSPSLSEWISHPLLLQLLAPSLLPPPSAPLRLCLLSYISTPSPSSIPLSPFFPHPRSALIFLLGPFGLVPC